MSPNRYPALPEIPTSENQVKGLICALEQDLSPPRTDRELVSLARTQPLSLRHNQKRIVWAVPRHSHYPPFPYILQIIPPFTNTQFALPHQMPFTSTTTPTLLNFLLSFCIKGCTRCKLGSAAPPPRRQVPKGKARRHSYLCFVNRRL